MARALGGRKDSKAATLLHRTPKHANLVPLKRSPRKRSSLLCSMSLNNKSSSNHSSTLVCSTNNSLNSTSSRSLSHSHSHSHSHNYNSSTSSNNRNTQVTLKRKKNRKDTNNNSKGSGYFVKRELVIGPKGNIMQKTLKYEDMGKLLAEADELLQQINSEVIADMEEEQRAQLEEHVQSLKKLKSEVHDKIGNEGATGSSSYSEGMHEAIVDIAKAMKALTSYLS
jgi:hypothetical protein